MEKFSQKDLLKEGFGSNLLKNVASGSLKLAGRGLGAAAKTAAKAVSPTAVDVASKAVGGVTSAVKKSFTGKSYSGPDKFIEDFLLSHPEVVSKVRNIKKYKKGADNFKRRSDPSIKTTTPYAERENGPASELNIGLKNITPKHLTNQSALYIVSFEVQLRNPKSETLDPIDLWIPVKNIPVKEVHSGKDKSGEKTYQLALHPAAVDNIAKNSEDAIAAHISQNPDTRKALDEFNRQVLNSQNNSDGVEVNSTAVPQPGDLPRSTIPRSRSYKNRN